MLEETSLKTKIDHLVGVYSDPNRDPRGHTITVAYFLEIIDGNMKGSDDASDAKFFNINDLPDLSFDHDKIIEDTIKELE